MDRPQGQLVVAVVASRPEDVGVEAQGDAPVLLLVLLQVPPQRLPLPLLLPHLLHPLLEALLLEILGMHFALQLSCIHRSRLRGLLRPSLSCLTPTTILPTRRCDRRAS